MDWMASLASLWLITLGWFAGLAVVFGVLARLMPCNPGMYWWKDRRAVGTDFAYWFVVPFFLRFCRTFLIVAGVTLLFGGQEPNPLPVRGWPLWQQCLAILLIQDVLLYAIHRFFHTPAAWKFHAVHHSPTVLDWTTTSRSHPVNNLLSFCVPDVTVLLLGFRPEALVVLAPFNLVYSSMVHANLSWTFGPLRFVLASPVFHRWHHTTQKEGIDKNFASTFPVLDLLFGTFYMPPGQLPEQFGTGEPDFPAGFWGQLLYPFQAATGWATLRRAAAALAVVALLAGGVVQVVRLAERNEQLAHAVEQAQQREAQAVRVTVRGRDGERTWAGNELIRARAVTAVALAADGQLAVSGSEDGAIKVWDAQTARERFTLARDAGRVAGVAVSADGQLVVAGGHDQAVRVWDVPSRREKAVLRGHQGAVLSVAISADGHRIVSGGADGTVRVWNAETGVQERVLNGHVGAITGVAVSADGRSVVSASLGTAMVWDADTGRERFTLNGHADLVYGVAISADGHRVVSGSFDETAKVWDAETGRELFTLGGHTGAVYSVALSPGGWHIVSGGMDGTVRLWDGETGREEMALAGHTGAVTGVAVSADGRRIVSGSRDGTVKVWDAHRGGPATAAAITE